MTITENGKNALLANAVTAIFVLLWGSAAIFTPLGLKRASPLVLLILRFGLVCRHKWHGWVLTGQSRFYRHIV